MFRLPARLNQLLLLLLFPNQGQCMDHLQQLQRDNKQCLDADEASAKAQHLHLWPECVLSHLLHLLLMDLAQRAFLLSHIPT